MSNKQKKSGKGKKTQNQVNTEILNKVFSDTKLGEAQIWQTFKSNTYNVEATIKELCNTSNTDQIKKTELFNELSNAKKKAQEVHSSSDEEESPKEFLRSSEDVYNRIKWDTSYNQDEFIIGYEDRFDGLQEIALQEFNSKEVSIDSFIPWHRVQYFKRNDEIVWDRKQKVDKIFKADEQPVPVNPGANN